MAARRSGSRHVRESLVSTAAPPATRSALDYIELLTDDGSFRTWDAEPDYSDVSISYGEEPQRVRASPGQNEALLTGEAMIRGTRVALIVSEFAFLGGSVGVEAAHRLAAAFERAGKQQLPVVALPASGGTRMQEGTRAFLAMIDVAASVAEYRELGLPYIVYLRHPTTGGVMASWGSLGHVTLAEPGALLGFLGPRVVRTLTGAEIPDAVQRAENLLGHDRLHAVVRVDDLAEYLAKLLQTLKPASDSQQLEPVAESANPEPDGWEAVLATRERSRLTPEAALRLGGVEVLWVMADDAECHGVVVGLARIADTACLIVAHTRRSVTAADLARIQSAIRIATGLRIPLVAMIDTVGAELSQAAGEAGLAQNIASAMSALLTADTPTVSVLIGQGSGGAAIALLPADRTVCLQNAWLAPLPPEGASTIRFRTPDHAPKMSRDQGIRAVDLNALGVTNEIVAEGTAVYEPATFAHNIVRAIARQVRYARAVNGDRLSQRHSRYSGL
ncbi:carboxyl transferase domain-containing protein [Microbacterium sp. LMI1-1-1.1]|uniref:carboxyl transferase domain-containing protein n=1 Tax=Microbacterium sp. LMI1-1-1.1 TaxID=3135223 RepID=UPI003467DB78